MQADSASSLHWSENPDPSPGSPFPRRRCFWHRQLPWKREMDLCAAFIPEDGFPAPPSAGSSVQEGGGSCETISAFPASLPCASSKHSRGAVTPTMAHPWAGSWGHPLAGIEPHLWPWSIASAVAPSKSPSGTLWDQPRQPARLT